MATQKRIWFERILCPIDFTEDSDEGLRYAVALVRAYNAKLFVCHCLSARDFEDRDKQATANALIDKSVRAHVHSRGGVALDWSSVLVAGQPSAEIVRECEDREVDLIVIRSRRRTLGHLLGSTAEALTRSAPCPILITGPGEREWAGLTTNEIDLRRILVAYDFSMLSDQALSVGLSLAQEFQATLELMHVLPGGTLRVAARDIDSYDAEIQQLAARLSSKVPAEAGQWCEIKEVLIEGDPAREILDHSARNSVDLICIGASAEALLINRVLGSTADRVVHDAGCPVLVARHTPRSVVSQGIGVSKGNRIDKDQSE